MTDPTIGEIARTVARIESKVDKAMDDHEARLRRLEKWMYAVPPTLVLGLVSLVDAYLRRQ